MLPGFRKCQWIGSEEIQGDLSLDGTILERVQTYTYLGMPMTYEGIDFKAYMPNLVLKA
jgi:hypothetical protein